MMRLSSFGWWVFEIFEIYCEWAGVIVGILSVAALILVPLVLIYKCLVGF
jgi:hypothetical protein